HCRSSESGFPADAGTRRRSWDGERLTSWPCRRPRLWSGFRRQQGGCEPDHTRLTPVQQIAYTREVLSRIRPSAPPEPASAIARAQHRRLPDRIQGAGTLYLWLRRGRTALRVARRLTAIGWEHEFVDACARIPLGNGDVQVSTAELCSALTEAEAHDT